MSIDGKSDSYLPLNRYLGLVGVLGLSCTISIDNVIWMIFGLCNAMFSFLGLLSLHLGSAVLQPVCFRLIRYTFRVSEFDKTMLS
jgi:hypothetical protein